MASTLASRFATCCARAINSNNNKKTTKTVLRHLKEWTFSSYFNVLGTTQSSRSIHLVQSRRQVQQIGLVGVPFRKGQGREGVELGPKALRDAGLVSSLQNLGHEVHDYGDLEFEEIKDDPKRHNINNMKSVSEAGKKICSAVKKVVDAGKICITLGGDHSLTTGGIYGHTLSQPNIVILWVDAHADINPPAASTTGNMHGMPLSFLVEEVQPYMSKIKEFDWVKPCISAKDIAYIGLRDVDPAERWLIEKLGIPCFSMYEIDLYGISTVLKMALTAIDPEGRRPIHFSFDIDSMDPSIAGSTGTPAMGGLSYREGMFIAETVANTGRLSALDVVEVNPRLGNETEQKHTVDVALDIIQAVFGKNRRGMLPPGFFLPRMDP